jgi:predicted kinase
MQLIVFSGLPGTGKSSLAEAIGRSLQVPVFAKDWLEAALRRSGLHENPACAERLGYAAYELLTMLAERQLMLGQSAVLDGVVTFERIRRQWHDLACQYGADFRVIECVCSDEAVQRGRIDGRQRHIPDWYELSWQDVIALQARFEPWQEERLIVDAVRPFAENVTAVLAYLAQS